MGLSVGLTGSTVVGSSLGAVVGSSVDLGLDGLLVVAAVVWVGSREEEEDDDASSGLDSRRRVGSCVSNTRRVGGSDNGMGVSTPLLPVVVGLDVSTTTHGGFDGGS